MIIVKLHCASATLLLLKSYVTESHTKGRFVAGIFRISEASLCSASVALYFFSSPSSSRKASCRQAGSFWGASGDHWYREDKIEVSSASLAATVLCVPKLLLPIQPSESISYFSVPEKTATARARTTRASFRPDSPLFPVRLT